MDPSIRDKLTQLSNKCETLSKSGKYPECIDIMEEIVSLKKQIYGMDHPQFQKSAEKLCQYLNLAAMIHLQKQKFELSLDCLRKAELVCRNSPQFKSTTYNNLACYYRRTGKIRTALTYLIQALELELKLEHPKTLADTHLNLCAVLSQLDRHEDAQQHVMLSIILLQDQFLGITMPYYFNRHNHEQQDEEYPVPEINDERLAVLSIAYHNLGVQFEHLKRYEEAVKIYKKALQLSKDYLSDNEQLIQNLAKVVNSATQQIEDQKKVHHEGKKQKYQREMSENKRQLYRELAKNTEKLKNLPKLKINKEPNALSLHSSTDPLNKTSYDKKYTDFGNDGHQQQQRNFATRKHPRYYKSNAVTPSNDEQSQSRQSYGLSFDHSRVD